MQLRTDGWLTSRRCAAAHWCALCVLLFAGVSHAFPPQEIAVTIDEAASVDANLIVQVPSEPLLAGGLSRAIAVSETHRLVVTGGREDKVAVLYVHALNEQGALSGATPQRIEITWPEAFAPLLQQTAVLDILFHPTLPLVYVWQNAVFVPGHAADTWTNMDQHFRPLMVYKVEGTNLVKVDEANKSSKRPGHFGYSRNVNSEAGRMALTPSGRRLYLPHARSPHHSALGVAELDDQGLVRRDETGEPDVEIYDMWHAVQAPLGRGMHAPSENRVIFAGGGGVGFGQIEPPPLRRHRHYLGAHVYELGSVTDRFMYVTSILSDEIFVVAHREGFMSSMPTRLHLPGTRLRSGPLHLTHVQKLAVGENARILLLDLDAGGLPTGRVTAAPVESRAPRALAYAPTFGRLYVATRDAANPIDLPEAED